MSTLYIRFVAHSSSPLQRSPLIERLIARASSSAQVLDWRADAFGLVAPPGTRMPPVATMALQGGIAGGAALGAAALGTAGLGTAGLGTAALGTAASSAVSAATGAGEGTGTSSGVGARVWVATPVHLSAGMTHVRFPVEGRLQLDAEEASALAADFNRVFAGAGVRMVAGRTGVLLCVFDEALLAATHDPEAAVGRDVFDFQSSGRDAPRLRRLTSEIEMWLFDHAVNRQRMGRGLPAITGLWFWGGGEASADMPTLPVWAAGRDVFFAAFGEVPKFPRDSRSGVVVLEAGPGSATWPEVERRWLQPAIAELRAGHIGQIHVSGAQRRFTMTRGLSLRFWRRPRPWWDYFGTGDGGLDGE